MSAAEQGNSSQTRLIDFTEGNHTLAINSRLLTPNASRLIAPIEVALSA